MQNAEPFGRIGLKQSELQESHVRTMGQKRLSQI
jgi:hypothetical protein